MTISIDVPEDMIGSLQEKWENVPRRALEALAVEGYRDGVLTTREVGRMLGHASRWETEAFVYERQAHLQYSDADLEADIQTIRNATC